MLIGIVKKIALRATLVVSAISGGLDYVTSLSAEIVRLRGIDQGLRKAIEIEAYNKQHWADLWFGAQAGHSAAQEMMVAEIEKLSNLSRRLYEDLVVARQKAKLPAPQEYSTLVAKISMGPWIDMVERYRESYVDVAHPAGVDTSVLSKPKA